MTKRLWAGVLILALAIAGCGKGKKEQTQGTEFVADTLQMTEKMDTWETTESEIQEDVYVKDLLSGKETEMYEEEKIGEKEKHKETEKLKEAETSGKAECDYEVLDMTVVMYAKTAVNVRKGPSTDYDKICVLHRNQQVSVTGQAENGWYRIHLENDGEGFVSDKYLADRQVPEKHVNVAAGNGGISSGGAGKNSGSTKSTENTGNTGGAGNIGNAEKVGNTGNTGNTGNIGNAESEESTGNTGNTVDVGKADGSGNTGNTGNTGNADNSGNAGNAESAGNVGSAGNTENAGTSENTGAVENGGSTGSNGNTNAAVPGGDQTGGGTNSGDFEEGGNAKNVQLSIPVYIQNDKGEYELFCTYIDYGYVGGTYTAHASAPAGWHISRADSGVITEQNTVFYVYLDKD